VVILESCQKVRAACIYIPPPFPFPDVPFTVLANLKTAVRSR